MAKFRLINLVDDLCSKISELLKGLERWEEIHIGKTLSFESPNTDVLWEWKEKEVCVEEGEQLDEYNPYCEECNSCGESLCCSGAACKKIQCKYGESYEYELRRAFYDEHQCEKLLIDALVLLKDSNQSLRSFIVKILKEKGWLLYDLYSNGYSIAFLWDIAQELEWSEEEFNNKLNRRWG